jgi:hypothetical protein
MPEPTPSRLDQALDGPAGAPAGNKALRRLRLRRFWTQADLAAAFEARSREIGRPLSLSVRQVRRWESAQPPLPLPAYQAVLEALFGVTIEEMGFQPEWARRPDPPRATPCPEQSAAFGPPGPIRAPEQVTGAAASGSAGGGATGPARSPLDDQERQDPVKRRQFMAGAVALGSGALGSIPQQAAAAAVGPRPAPPAPSGHGGRGGAGGADPSDEQPGIDPDSVPAAVPSMAEVDGAGLVNGYSVITAQHRALYWSVPAAAMFAPVAAHSELGLGLLRSAGSPALRASLAASVAETAMLAARLAFFDLQQPRLAEGYFAVALDAARESADRPLTGAVLAHMAFVPAFAGQPRRARDLIAEAHRQVRGVAGATQLSWMCAVESEVEARLGDGAAANDLIARAEGALAGARRFGADDRDPQWLDFFDGSRLAGFKGYCRLSAGRCADAAVALEQTLRTLPLGASKQRSITLADLARARAGQGELEEAALLLGGAVDQLRTHWYATGVDRVDAVRRHLAAAGAPARILIPVDEARRALETMRP